MRLLIVDDNAGFRRLIGDVLAPVATAVFECADGVHALREYERHRPDVVLMDIAMHELDGLSATSAILAAHPEARVVMVTQYDGTDLREAARAAGACGYVVKEQLLGLQAVLERITGEQQQ